MCTVSHQPGEGNDCKKTDFTKSTKLRQQQIIMLDSRKEISPKRICIIQKQENRMRASKKKKYEEGRN